MEEINTATNQCSSCGFCKQSQSTPSQNSIILNEARFLKISFIIYGIPLIALLLGFVLGFYLPPLFGINKYNELISFAFGIFFMIISFFLINKLEKKTLLITKQK